MNTVSVILLGSSVALTTTGQMLIKRGATLLGEGESIIGALFRSRWLIGGFGCAVIAPVAYVLALRTLPLSVAFPAASVTHVLVVMGARLIFKESMPVGAWLGVALIAAGVTLIGLGAQ